MKWLPEETVPDQYIPSQVGHLCIGSGWGFLRLTSGWGLVILEEFAPLSRSFYGCTSGLHQFVSGIAIYPAERDEAYLLNLSGELIVSIEWNRIC